MEPPSLSLAVRSDVGVISGVSVTAVEAQAM